MKVTDWRQRNPGMWRAYTSESGTSVYTYLHFEECVDICTLSCLDHNLIISRNCKCLFIHTCNLLFSPDLDEEVYHKKNPLASANVSYSYSLVHIGTFIHSLCGLYFHSLKIVLKVITT